jgi:hypothetical protein
LRWCQQQNAWSDENKKMTGVIFIMAKKVTGRHVFRGGLAAFRA